MFFPILLISLAFSICAVMLCWRWVDRAMCSTHHWRLVLLSFGSLMDLFGVSIPRYKEFFVEVRACGECQERSSRGRVRSA